VAVNIRQVRTDLHAQNQHERHALTELNERFRLFFDHVQVLESQNSKYAAQIADLRQQSFGISSIDAQSEHYLHLQSDLATFSYEKVDYAFDFELFQLQIEIYRQMIDVEQRGQGSIHSGHPSK